MKLYWCPYKQSFAGTTRDSCRWIHLSTISSWYLYQKAKYLTYTKAALPTIVGSLPFLKYIFRTEEIQIVHGHSAFSTLAHEALFAGSLLGLGTVFTDHSLFGFADASAIVTNTFLRYSLANSDHCICVSHTGKENTVLRSGVPKTSVSVIPNAVDSDIFKVW